ncbi:MAG: hypothetical protein HZB70_02240 [Candidatus Berkelbacteria bacterium]|nr:MAG: hypothetical protein HZB70_02240 [Candidatus Berkelbacteria bacterium]QQG51864.1 MAG: hypothetical protein HY845_00755 [Candidatus Berkelbacteria bacterium]
MELNPYILLGYGVFLAVMLLVNLLYFFQVYKYRIPGDASIPVLVIHIFLLLLIITGTSVYISNLG